MAYQLSLILSNHLEKKNIGLDNIVTIKIKI